MSLVDDLRVLFSRGEHDVVVARTAALAKRRAKQNSPDLSLSLSVRAMSLLHLSRYTDASALLESLSQPELEQSLLYARLYLACATNQQVDSALQSVSQLKLPETNVLHAQLLYRAAQYPTAAEKYSTLLSAAQARLAEKKRPPSRSLWSIASKPAPPPVTAAELSQLHTTVNELATNTTAALVLSAQYEAALQLATSLRSTYELQYNTACSQIGLAKFADAETSLQKADALVRAHFDPEIDDIDELLAPVRVQSAYLRHLSGDIAEAKEQYVAIMNEAKADSATTAVAANNLTVALGQLAFGQQNEKSDTTVLTKDHHQALVEGLKKMKVTSGKTVQRTLTSSQRAAMARNRAILLVQMGRVDACRQELTRLKGEFPKDPLVPLVEATLVVREGGVNTAEKVLENAGQHPRFLAARIQLLVDNGEYEAAVKLLDELFEARPAAVVTAAEICETMGDIDGAVRRLEALRTTCSSTNKVKANKILAKTLLRHQRYQQAAEVLREVMRADGSDTEAKALLAIAASYVNVSESEEMVGELPYASSSISSGEAKQLESLPPPKRKHTGVWKKVEQNGDNVDDAAARAEKARERKKRKRKKRLPKNYDPDGPPPDPERWLPKTLRSGYKKKKSKENQFRGSQGADAAEAEAQQKKNERMAANKAATTNEGGMGRAKMQKRRKNRR